jgi:hypothetical protein
MFTVIAVATFLGPSPGVQATPSTGSAPVCGMSSNGTPNAEGGTHQVGEVDGQLLTLLDGVAGLSGTLVCTIQVGEATHAGTDVAGASAYGIGVITLAPSVISYDVPASVPVFLCTSYVDDDGTVLYWDDSNDPAIDGSWSPSPDAGCTRAAVVGGDGASQYVRSKIRLGGDAGCIWTGLVWVCT